MVNPCKQLARNTNLTRMTVYVCSGTGKPTLFFILYHARMLNGIQNLKPARYIQLREKDLLFVTRNTCGNCLLGLSV